MPIQLGYWLSSEEHAPDALVRHARLAEEAGFDYAMISDHFHPWIDRQGQSPFVWSVLGAIAQTTERIGLATGVTCPIIRMHPATVAHAAATVTAMAPGRFSLGLGSGENLNEHVVGRGWPEATIRLEMLREAIQIIRELFRGGQRTWRGRYFTLEDARLYTLPDQPPPILIAAAGPKAAELSGELGDGLVMVGDDEDTVRRFEVSGGHGKPRYSQFHCAWTQDKKEGRRLVHEIWPTSVAAPGTLGQDVRLPSQFEDLAKLVSEDDTADTGVIGPDPEPYIEKIRKIARSGIDHIAIHQIGPDQDGFIRFVEREIMPHVDRAPESERDEVASA